jgi:hypothetical protein
LFPKLDGRQYGFICPILNSSISTNYRRVFKINLTFCVTFTDVAVVVGVVRYTMAVGFITTYAISSYHHSRCEFEPRSSEAYSIQNYVIKFVSDLRQVGGFPRVYRFPPPIKLTKIFLKVVLSTVTKPYSF